MELFIILYILLAMFTRSGHSTHQDMPPCLSSCMAPFPESHSPETCRANWTSTITACIDRACSVSISSSSDVNTRTSMFFVPNHGITCPRSVDSGAEQALPTLQLRPGVCQTSSYQWQSFLVSYGQNGIPQNCSLALFEKSQCAGGANEVMLSEDSDSHGQCWVVGGQSVMLSCGEGGSTSDNKDAHNYLSSFCSISTRSNSHTTSTTCLPSPTTLVAADTSTVPTTLAKTLSINSTLANSTSIINNDPANSTASITSSVAVIIPSIMPASGPMGGEGDAEKVVKQNGAAQWALVVVMFARSLMY